MITYYCSIDLPEFSFLQSEFGGRGSRSHTKARCKKLYLPSISEGKLESFSSLGPEAARLDRKINDRSVVRLQYKTKTDSGDHMTRKCSLRHPNRHGVKGTRGAEGIPG